MIQTRILISALTLFALAFSSPSWAQQQREIGERLIAQSGAPERFSLEADDQSIVVIDNASRLRCSIPPNAPHMSLSVSGSLLQCEYAGGVHVNWMVIPTSTQAGQVELRPFVAAYALMQQDQRANLQPMSPPAFHPVLQQIFPNAPQPFRVWMRDTTPGVDYVVALSATDMNGHRVMQIVSGPADPVQALSDLSFVTSTAATPE